MAIAFRLVTIAALTLFAVGVPGASADEVNIYSYRQADLIQPFLDGFTEQSGIVVNVLFLKKGLIERVKAEGANSPVDVILTTDIGRLADAKSRGITQRVASATIDSNIPARYRDRDGNWFGLTVRGRVVFASAQRVAENDITYEALADPKWKGRICTRSGQHAYNVALIASMIAHHGAEKAEAWLRGVKENLARKPAGNDRAQAKAIFAGECDLGIGNTYYVGLMQTNDKKPEQRGWRKAIKLIFPNRAGRGTHANISGMAMAKSAPNRDNALKLMEFLSSAEAQEIYAKRVFEYPVKPGIELSEIVASFGDMNADTLPLDEIAKNRKAASILVDRVGYDDGPSS